MKFFFLVLGLLWIVASAAVGFIGSPAGPSNGELLAVVLITGGALMLGISHVLAKLAAIESALSDRTARREIPAQSPAAV